MWRNAPKPHAPQVWLIIIQLFQACSNQSYSDSARNCPLFPQEQRTSRRKLLGTWPTIILLPQRKDLLYFRALGHIVTFLLRQRSKGFYNDGIHKHRHLHSISMWCQNHICGEEMCGCKRMRIKSQTLILAKVKKSAQL